MKNYTDKVSVAMTTFNGESFLRKQLDSIFNQTIPVYELIVCDDSSTDKTLEILEEYSQNYNLKYFINEKQLGFVKNFEKSISLCTGDYIALSDQDDIWFSHKLEHLLLDIGDNLLIHSNCSLINEEDQVIIEDYKGKITSHLDALDFMRSNVCTGCTMLFKKELLKYALPFPEGLSYHDWYIGLYAAYLGKIKYTDKILIGYRQHGGQDTGALLNESESIKSNMINRLLGKEYSAMVGSKKQLNNLLAIQSVFEHDKPFAKEIRKNIEYLDDYVHNFFHFKTAQYDIESIPFLRKKKGLKRMFYLLKHSIG